MSEKRDVTALTFVQITATKDAGPGVTLHALADDGSVWKHEYEIDHGGRHFWTRIPTEDRRG